MEIVKIEPVRRGRVRPDKERQEMLGHLDDQITDIFLFLQAEPGRSFAPQPGKLRAPETHMDAVVGQTHVRYGGKHDQLLVIMPASWRLCHAIQLAAAEHLVTEMHVVLFFLAPVPSRQAGTHEKLPVKGIGYQLFSLFWRTGGWGRNRSWPSGRFFPGQTFGLHRGQGVG